MIKDGSPAKAVQKKSYAKPSICEVKLRPEQAVLGDCKSINYVGPLQVNCAIPNSCSTQSS